ncbi:hypothetical protein Mic7113_3476 [Allocoleopsis franciscana PCC 7113]|uniref:Uncharacterized protein n=1 Tax=Allocoleopsis franciscana PCC 7113 TaxID=1173027 RepID=K9WHF6_9CYAN|nr:hypothetical protein Mic7113_3476 [Allocoleopsis franciscana PCC 7113]
MRSKLGGIDGEGAIASPYGDLLCHGMEWQFKSTTGYEH